jgi:DNA-binding PadR family transcriptional regulator
MMSATRLLILGVVRRMQPTYGYEIRRELESWRAERWANIAYGSIYFALNKMAEEGLIEAVGTEQVGRRPARTQYRITERGEEAFQALLREYWWDAKPILDPFQVALAFMNQLPRDELIAALRHRIDMARSNIEAAEAMRESPLIRSAPRHVAENFRLWGAHAEAELRWCQQILEKIERRELP